MQEKIEDRILDFYLGKIITCLQVGDAQHVLEVVAKHAGPRRLPLPGETATFAPGRAKTAALVFDRVWLPLLERPELLDLSFFGHTTAEVAIFGHWILSLWQNQYPSLVVHESEGSSIRWSGGPPLSHLVAESALSGAIQKRLDIDPEELLIRADNETPRALGYKLFEAFGFPISRVYSDGREFNQDAKLIGNDFILASLVDLDLVREDALSWDQVLEFRQDKDARVKFQRMLRWLNRGTAGKEPGQILEEIESRYEDYSRVLKKHGIETMMGALETFVEPKTLLSATALGAAVAAGSSPDLGLLSGFAATIGQVAVKVVKKVAEKHVVKQNSPEIAFLFEAGRRM